MSASKQTRTDVLFVHIGVINKEYRDQIRGKFERDGKRQQAQKRRKK